MKTIEVVAAIIREGDRVLATQRGYGEFEGMWEFPGGKIEHGEERVEALKREIGRNWLWKLWWRSWCARWSMITLTSI